MDWADIPKEEQEAICNPQKEREDPEASNNEKQNKKEPEDNKQSDSTTNINHGKIVNNITYKFNVNNKDNISESRDDCEEKNKNYDSSFFEYIIDSDQLHDSVRTYVKHHYLEERFDRLLDQPILFLYGEKNIGRFTMAKNIMFQKGFCKAHCFNEVSILKLAKEYKWEKNECYIIRKLVNLEHFRKIYDRLISDCLKSGASVIFLIETSDYQDLENIIYDLSLKIEMPIDVTLLVKKHILTEYIRLTECNPDDDYADAESIETAVDKQLEHESYLKYVEDIRNVDFLVRLAKIIAEYFIKEKDFTKEIDWRYLFQTITNNKVCEEKIKEIEDIQEKILLLAVNIIDKFPKENIYEKYLRLEEILRLYMSKPEKKLLDKNIFWSLPWSERLEKVSAYLIQMKLPYSNREFGIISLKDDYDADEVFHYFLTEFDWYTSIKQWLLVCLKDYHSYDKDLDRYERDILITALFKLAKVNQEDILSTLESICLTKKCDKIYVFTYAKLLRKLYENAAPNIGKKFLKAIHYYLTSKNANRNQLGINICKYGFYDIPLTGLIDDIIKAVFHTKKDDYIMDTASCISKMIYYQEDIIDDTKSIFCAINSYPDLFKNQDSSMVYILIFYISSNYDHFYNKKTRKYHTYPSLLFIYGKNIAVRKHIIEFIKNCIMHYELKDNIAALLYLLQEYVYANKETPNLVQIWTDMTEKLKNESQYCSNLLSNIIMDFKNKKMEIIRK